MVDKIDKVTQLAERIDSQSAVALTDKQKLSIYKKSQKSGYPVDILEEVYHRGIESWNEQTNQTQEQFAFSRINSFISGGRAADMDKDLLEKEVWDSPNPRKNSEKLSAEDKAAARARARRAGRRYPNLIDNMWATQRNEEVSQEEKNNPRNREVGTSELTKIYAEETPGQSSIIGTIKKVVREELEINETIRKINGDYRLYSSSGKNLGTYPTREGAEKRERQVQYFKHANEETISEATYKGKTVKLNKPFRTPGEKKKFAVYVDLDGDGNAKIVRFGDPNLSIKKHMPARKKSYCARSSGQGNLTDKGSANYWSRKMWDC
jgi:hypothetical protein